MSETKRRAIVWDTIERLAFHPISDSDRRAWLSVYAKTLHKLWGLEPMWDRFDSNDFFDIPFLDLKCDYTIENVEKYSVSLQDSSASHSYWQEYDLHLMSVAKSDDLLDEGSSLVIVALVDAKLYIRTFDARGKKVVDKAENKLLSGEETLTTFKRWLNSLPDISDISQEDKQKIIENATLFAGYSYWQSHIDPRYLSKASLHSASGRYPRLQRAHLQRDIEAVLDGMLFHPRCHTHLEDIGVRHVQLDQDSGGLSSHEVRIGGGIENPYVFLFHLRYQFCLVADQVRQTERQRLIDLFDNSIRVNSQNVSARDLFGF